MTWTFDQIEPQKARGPWKALRKPLKEQLAYLEDNYETDEWMCDEKKDGDRRVGQFTNGVVRLTGCRQSVQDGLFVEKTENVPHISNYPVKGLPLVIKPNVIKKLDGTVVDGEMVVPVNFSTGAGGKSKWVTSIMGSLPAEAHRKQAERGFLQYALFDLLYYRGKDLRALPLAKRRLMLSQVIQEWGNPFVKQVPYTYTNKRAFLEDIWDEGGEGIILKHVDHRYGQHLRWIKVKYEACADVVIMGYKPPKEMSRKVDGMISPTKYAGKDVIGSIVFGQYLRGQLVEVGSVSGIDEKLRDEISQNKAGWINQVIEIRHYGREPTGAFRHPQYRRPRPDKNPTDCVLRMEEV